VPDVTAIQTPLGVTVAAVGAVMPQELVVLVELVVSRQAGAVEAVLA
jgi:hypothetical protein